MKHLTISFVVVLISLTGCSNAPLGGGPSPAPQPNVGCATDSECDDGLFCNGAESCFDGVCLSGEPPCTGVQDCDEAEGDCFTPLPPPSNIPPGIYSGRIDINVTLWVDGVPQFADDSLAFTIIFDENGRFLDADGVPFLAGKVYFWDAGTLSFESFARSITVIDNQIVLRFDLTAHADTGTSQAELTGSQTETITFDAATGTLTFVRTQQYGGIGSDGAILHFSTEGNAILERG